MQREGVDISSIHNDCGMLIFDTVKQDVHSGGSGCGCSASVFCSYIMKNIKAGKLHNISFKRDEQTHAGEYGSKFHGELKLEEFVVLQTGEWIHS